MPGVSCQRNSGPRIHWSKNNLSKHLEVSKEVNLGLPTFNMQRDEFEHTLFKTTFIYVEVLRQLLVFAFLKQCI